MSKIRDKILRGEKPVGTLHDLAEWLCELSLGAKRKNVSFETNSSNVPESRIKKSPYCSAPKMRIFS